MPLLFFLVDRASSMYLEPNSIGGNMLVDWLRDAAGVIAGFILFFIAWGMLA